MMEFFDVAERLRRSNQIPNTEAYDLSFRGIQALNQAHSKAQLDTDNLESVFSAFEMAELLRRLQGIDETEKLPGALRQLIAATLSAAVMFPWSTTSDRLDPPADYKTFVEKMQEYRKVAGGDGAKITLITFNYDMALDYALWFHSFQGREIDYGLNETPKEGALPLLKLHGSLHWQRSGASNDADAGQVDYLASERLFAEAIDSANTDAREARNFHRAGGASPSTAFPLPISIADPFIVPPTWSKGGHYLAIRNVWRSAAEALRKAERIYVIGYSLPESDQFFKLLYALGTIGSARLKRFWVYNPDRSGATQARFEALLGASAKTRFKYIPREFKDVFDNTDELALEF